MLGFSPLQTATIQSAILSLASSFLARLLTPNAPPPPLLSLFIFTLISTPPNYLWQGFLERRLPGYTSDESKIKVDDDGQGVTVEKKLNIRNTVTKVLIDQTLGAAVNTAAWLMGVRALRGASLEECIGLVRDVSKISTIRGSNDHPEDTNGFERRTNLTTGR